MRPFKNVFGNKPRMSVFDLSYEKKLTCDMGQLIPVLCDEVVPGDYWKIGNQAIIRMQPLVAPVLHQIDVYVHYFFVPYRLLWDGFEDFITNPDSEEVLPLWNPTKTEVGSLWDFLGFLAFTLLIFSFVEFSTTTFTFSTEFNFFSSIIKCLNF